MSQETLTQPDQPTRKVTAYTVLYTTDPRDAVARHWKRLGVWDASNQETARRRALLGDDRSPAADDLLAAVTDGGWLETVAVANFDPHPASVEQKPPPPPRIRV